MFHDTFAPLLVDLGPTYLQGRLFSHALLTKKTGQTWSGLSQLLLQTPLNPISEICLCKAMSWSTPREVFWGREQGGLWERSLENKVQQLLGPPLQSRPLSLVMEVLEHPCKMSMCACSLLSSNPLQVCLYHPVPRLVF